MICSKESAVLMVHEWSDDHDVKCMGASVRLEGTSELYSFMNSVKQSVLTMRGKSNKWAYSK